MSTVASTASGSYSTGSFSTTIGCLRIRGGKAKNGSPERLDVTIRAGEVACVVGPTGSGKSRLLADVECLAQGDTPSGRLVTVDGQTPTDEERFSAAHKLVAQLSQSMNYVLELGVGEFLALHARSRGMADEAAGRVCREVVSQANLLCGEPFDQTTPVSLLSGGQSRSLMIADVALLSRSPIVLVDELENAGVDRRRSLDLLLGSGKIVLVATHDPLLMLMGGRRLAMSGGAVERVIVRTSLEEGVLAELAQVEAGVAALRDDLRGGQSIDQPLQAYLGQAAPGGGGAP